MESEAKKTLVRRYVELWNTGNLAIADEVLAADFVDHAHPELLPGPGSVKQAVQDFRTAFPDAQATIEHMVCEGDMVAFRWTMRGTHQQTFAGFQPTGKEIVLRGMNFMRIVNGKCAELWTCQETFYFMVQLGEKVSFPE